MLIRIVAQNILSFGAQEEFHMIPNDRLRTLKHHLYPVSGIDLLKLTSIYGANAAGKSNLITVLAVIKSLVVKDSSTRPLRKLKFKFGNSERQMLAIEFIEDDIPFYYAITINKGNISQEELYISGLGIKKDELIFERRVVSGKSRLKFLNAFEKDPKGPVLKEVLLQEFVKPDKSILKLLADRENEHLTMIKKAFSWFDTTLTILRPETRPRGLAHHLDIDSDFKLFAESLIRSLNLGIDSLVSKKQSFKDFKGNLRDGRREEVIKHFEENPDAFLELESNTGELVSVVKEGDEIVAKQLGLMHRGGAGKEEVMFIMDELSDGTIRLLDFLPLLERIISKRSVMVIDEIERSIHPSLIFEIVKKFAEDDNTLGQLIFTTHESNLLDQDIFRLDEIWFVEKSGDNCSHLYPLSDYKVHKTIDIQKGYLNGRYGAVPFLSDLKALNWHVDDSEE